MGRMRGASVAGRAGGIAMAALLLCLCLCLLPAIAGAQDKPLTAYFRETWTTRQGLPHNQVNAIAQTPDGYLWFGTWEGLVRYNGLEFHAFDRGNTPALKDNGVRSVRASEDGAVVTGNVATNDTDIDAGDTRTYTLNAPVAGLTLNANGTYSFDPSNAAYQNLKAGETRYIRVESGEQGEPRLLKADAVKFRNTARRM